MSLVAISAGSAAVLVIVFGVILFAFVLNLTFLRSRKAAKANELAADGHVAAPAPVSTPAQKAPKLISRRELFRSSLLLSLGAFALAFGAASIGFLWPKIRGFGGKFEAGTPAEIKQQIQATNEPVYVASARAWVVAYEGEGVDEALGIDYADAGVLVEGLMALYQRCVHLGCRVPFCGSSQWFECPCHGSKYSGVGEYKLGPAPRGMDRFKLSVEGGQLIIDTAPTSTVLGPPRGADTTGQNPEGPFCV